MELDPKKIAISTVAGGVLLLILQMLFSAIANAVAPYSMADLGGMRAAADPLMSLFLLSPFVIAAVAALLYSSMEECLPGDARRRGAIFGVLLLLVVMVPDLFVIFSTMEYPAGFYIAQLLTGIVGYPAIGMLFARIWERF